jgi:hypothetical protein
MKKIQLLGIALVAVCAFSALVTASAFALTFALAEWLEGGVAVAATKNVVAEGELLFSNLENGANFLCSGEFDGNVRPNGADEVTQVLDLTLKAIPELDPGVATTGLKCGVDTAGEGFVGCKAGTEVWPLNLPWKSELMLDTENGLFYDLAVLNASNLGPGYNILCLLKIGGEAEELCTIVNDETWQQVANVATAVRPLGAVEPESNCGTGTENGLLENNTQNEAFLLLVSGALLEVSE